MVKETAAQFQKRTKNLVRESRNADLNYVSLETAISNLIEAGKDLTDITVEIEKEYGYDDYCSCYVVVTGWRNKTQAELNIDRLREERDKENAQKSKEQAKKAEWTLAQNLYTKYKDKLKKLDS